METNTNLACLIWVSLVTLLSVQQSGSVDTYSLSYSYFDEIAQSYCASVGSGYAFAIRRNCVGEAPTCNDMCKSTKKEILDFIGNQRDSVSCYDAINVFKRHPVLKANPSYTQPDSGKVSLGTYGYGYRGCTWKPNHCGPNYCCCKAY